MRRLVVPLLVLLLAVPSAAWALRRAPGDGTLSVARADDYVALNIRGSVLGRTAGYIEIMDPKDGDCSAEAVFGVRAVREFEMASGLLRCRYVGPVIRFRLVGGRQWVRVYGPDISISAVGRGSVWLRNRNDDRVGTYSFDGEKPSALPTRLTELQLGVPLTSGGSG
ncbi:MAG TPA: hypothetical protein VM290_09615 [Gaiellaceae bacterium]|nr:hypothetical protein [Gaiellaceae bacterium]